MISIILQAGAMVLLYIAVSILILGMCYKSGKVAFDEALENRSTHTKYIRILLTMLVPSAYITRGCSKIVRRTLGNVGNYIA